MQKEERIEALKHSLRQSKAFEKQYELNQAIREHRQKKKEAKSKAERERIGKWEPERMENGSPGLLLFIPFAPVFQYNMLASAYYQGAPSKEERSKE